MKSKIPTLKMLQQFFSDRTKRTQRITAVLAIILVAGIGTYLLTGSHAATPYVSINAYDGTVTGPAAKSTSCSGANNNSCVVFGSVPSVTPPPTGGAVLGANSANDLGAGAASMFTKAGITYARVEFDMPSMSSNSKGLENANAYSLSSVAEINTDDNTPLSSIDPNAYASYGLSLIKANPNTKLWEAGNEVYLKGGIANPQAYGKMYLDVYNAVNCQGTYNVAGCQPVTGVKLLFNMFGDYDRTGHGSWSQDANNGGWLRDAVNANPGLAAAIASEAFSSHPYGGIGVNNADYGGTAAIAAQEKVAQTVLGSVPGFYITEFGYNLTDVGTTSASSKFATPCSSQQAGQAYLLTEAYDIFLGDSHVKGIWWYSAHDDGTGQFGLLNGDLTARPSFNALAKEVDLKQHTPTCTP